MNEIRYRGMIKTVTGSKRRSKKMGQNFLVNRDIAKTEARFSEGKRVVEMGPGLGILTDELCGLAKSVIAVEKDKTLYEILNHELDFKNLELINEDFFEVKGTKFDECDIMISNIPYSLSSKVIGWLSERKMPAVLCLQKEFVEHMLAKPHHRSYSKLSVTTSLYFTVTKIIDVPSNNFYPVPKVDSSLIFLKPKKERINKKAISLISLIMEHKKKKIRNAIINSIKSLNITKDEAHAIVKKVDGCDKRAFQMEPGEILNIAERILKELG